MSVRNLLFHFQHYAQALRGGAVLAEWRYTAAAEPVTHDGLVFEPVAVTLSDVRLNGEKSAGQVEIGLPADNAFALAVFEGLPTGSVWLRVIETDGLTTRVWFSGTVRGVSYESGVAKVQASAAIYLLQRPALRMRYAEECQWDHYGSRCGVDKAAHKQQRTVLSVSADGRDVRFTEAIAAADFKHGLLEKSGASRLIVGYSGADTVSLFSPLRNLQPGDVVDLYPGCDRTTSAQTGCKKYDNVRRYGGFPFTPDKNIYLDGVA